MKHLIIAVSAALLLTACATHKKIIDKTHSATDSVVKSTHLRVTTRTIDTLAKSKPDSLRAAITIPGYVPPALPTIAGTPTQQWTFASGSLSVTATLDKRTGTIDLQANTKPQDVPVQLHEATIEADTHEAAKATVQDTLHKQTAPQQNWSAIIWGIIVLVIIAIATYIWYRLRH